MLVLDTETRSEKNLTRKQLLDDYGAIALKHRTALEATALRTESFELREVLAHLASFGKMSLVELESSILNNQQITFDKAWLASLARVAALQNFRPSDHEFSLRALRLANAESPEKSKVMRFRKLEIDLLVTAGRDADAARILELDPALAASQKHLTAELWNPYRGGVFSSHDKWIRNFNTPFSAQGLLPVSVASGHKTPFDGLFSEPEAKTWNGPLVTVIMTTYSPEADSLLTSVRSILNQTWQNLELIVVDDHSPDPVSPLLNNICIEDSRVRLIRAPRNGGTYLARNIGLAAAEGVYITGQDDDDWSHPQRLEQQVLCLEEDLHAPGCRVMAITASSNLERIRPGYNFQSPNASSLMFRRHLLPKVGGYLPVRKAADTEFQKRLETIAGTPVVELKLTLTIVRILANSLSRSDFRVGWSHPARRVFKDSYNYWHENSDPIALNSCSSSAPPIVIPRKFALAPVHEAQVDVVFAGDWRQYGRQLQSMLEEVSALIASGYSVGILHLEAARFMSAKDTPLCEPIQQMLNEGKLSHVLYDDVVDVGLLILRYPSILQFPTYFSSKLRVSQVVILANQVPSEKDGSDIRYLVEPCAIHAERMFGQRGLWVPQSPTVRHAIEDHIPANELADFDMPGILSVNDWSLPRDTFRGTVPVVGRHSPDSSMKWPDSPQVLNQTYPRTGEFDVRIMGGAEVPLDILGLQTPPPEWVVFERDELPVRTFLGSIDFFVLFQNSMAYEAFERSALEALATGCVVVLPEHCKSVFGNGAVYCLADEVADVVNSFYSDPLKYRTQSDLALKVASTTFGYENYAGRVGALLRTAEAIKDSKVTSL